MAKISMPELLMNRISEAELSPNQASNAAELIRRVNAFLAGYAKPVIVNSGYRSPEINASTSNASAKSWHLQCAAVDLADDGSLRDYCIKNLEAASRLGIWFEDWRWTPTWTHMQIYPPTSGRRIFVPSSKPATAPKAWSGIYDSRYDSLISKK